MTQVALSVSRQQSSRCSGLQIQRELTHVLDGHALFQERLRILRGVLAVGDLDVGDLLGGRAVVVHVAHERRREVLTGAAHAERHLGQIEPAHRLGGAGAGAADAELRVAVHRAVDRHRVAHPGFDRAHGEADQRLGRGAAAHHVHVEVQANAEVGRHVRGERRIAALVVEHAVHVAGLEPGVEDRLADCLHRHGPRRAAGAAASTPSRPRPRCSTCHVDGSSPLLATIDHDDVRARAVAGVRLTCGRCSRRRPPRPVRCTHCRRSSARSPGRADGHAASGRPCPRSARRRRR